MKMKFTLLFSFFLFTIHLLNAQLVLERDINQEPASSDPFYFSELNNVLYFSADDGINGDELYNYDINSQTAELVANLQPYNEGSSIDEVISWNGKIYLSARDGNNIDNFLVVHDPVSNTTDRLYDSNNQEIRNPYNMTIFNNQLYFSAEFSDVGQELGRIDLATNDLDTLSDTNVGGNGSPNFLTEANGQLWFVSSDGSTSQLYRFDPTNDQVEKINYQNPVGLDISFSFLKLFDGKLFFKSFIQGEGSELGIYDISTNTVLDFPEIYVGAGSSNPQGFQEFDGKLFFSARMASIGRELFVYDPNTNAVTLVEDIYVGSNNGNPGALFVLNGKLYFTANTTDADRKLFSLDANGNTLTEEAVLDNNGFSSGLTPQIVANGELYLTGTKPEYGRELFKFVPGNSELTLAADINTTTIGSDPYGFTEYNGKLFFGADEVNSGREIWVYNPMTGMVDIVSDFPGNTSPYGFTVLDDKLYFSGLTSVDGYGLHIYDDATGTITPTSFITPNSIGHVTDILAFNGKIFFTADTDDYGNELYVYDPNNNTFTITQDINPNGDSYAENLFIFQDEIYFEANDGVTGVELWKYNDDTGLTSLVADINPNGDGRPSYLTDYAGEIYFSAYNDDTSYDVYSYNPSNGVVTQRTDVSGNLDPRYFAVYDDKLFFSGRYSSSVNAELVYYDASTDELVLTEDLSPGASGPRDLIVFNDKLYFSTFTPDYGRELWEYSDTTLSIVSDLYPGVPDADPENLTLFNGKLYFAANDGIRGAELWSLAECLNVFVDAEPQIGPDGFGSIDLTIEGGLPPYTITWSNGAVTEDIFFLLPGIYTATISDASGCLSEITAEVTFMVGDEKVIISEEKINISPNPSTGIFTLNSDGLKMESIEVFDLHGKVIYQNLIENQGSNFEIKMEDTAAGVYLVKVKTEEGVVVKKLVLN